VYFGVVPVLGCLVPVRHGIDERVVLQTPQPGWLWRLLRAFFRRR
jgi:hypothetical protein